MEFEKSSGLIYDIFGSKRSCRQTVSLLSKMDDVHSGPHGVHAKAFLTRQQRTGLFAQFGAQVQVRYRESWGRKGLTLCGPPETITATKKEAEKIMEENSRRESPEEMAGDDVAGESPIWIVRVSFCWHRKQVEATNFNRHSRDQFT